jgi:hypothetical protein
MYTATKATSMKRRHAAKPADIFFLSNNDTSPPNNGAIPTNATIIKAVMSSAAEAELGALYLNAKEATYLCQILQEMGHPQPCTPIQTDNTTAEGVINNKIQPKCTKAKDMRFHWLRDREAQRQIKIILRPGKTNLADYFTKHHPPTHHVNVRSEFLTKVKDLAEARRQRLEQGQTKKPHKAQATTSYKGVLDSEELHTLSSKLLAIKENNLNSPCGRFFKREVFM